LVNNYAKIILVIKQFPIGFTSEREDAL